MVIRFTAVYKCNRADAAPILIRQGARARRALHESNNMANHKSAIKRIRQNEKRRLHNRAFRNRARTLVKKARVAIASGDAEEAQRATMTAVRDLDKLASRGVIHKRNAARRKSRLTKQMMALMK